MGRAPPSRKTLTRSPSIQLNPALILNQFATVVDHRRKGRKLLHEERPKLTLLRVHGPPSISVAPENRSFFRRHLGESIERDQTFLLFVQGHLQQFVQALLQFHANRYGNLRDSRFLLQWRQLIKTGIGIEHLLPTLRRQSLPAQLFVVHWITGFSRSLQESLSL